MSSEKEDVGGEEIWVFKFNEESAQEFREQVLDIAKKDASAVIPIYIDSYGGYVDSLAKMIETMDEVPNRFITICMGKSMSCGTILLSHGDLRFCGRFSRVMIHNISSVSWGDAYAMKADSDEALKLNKRFMGLLAENCGISYDKLQQLIKDSVGSKEIWFSAETAQKFNIVDEVGIPRISPVVSWGFEVPPPKPRTKRQKGIKKTTSAKSK
jgi:ATP-dependent Clp endopeptidase proteolytic subunit ClpP